MEATHANVSSGCVNYGMSIGYNNQFAATSAPVHPTVAPRFEPYYGLRAAYPPSIRPANSIDNQFRNSAQNQSSGCHSSMQAPAPAPAPAAGVSNCYVFKSRLQEYAQKVGLPTPTYETIREGPSHAPFFRSTVIVGGVRYDSLLGFFNRKAAEQSAAEVALMALSTVGENNKSINVPLHETGLCKNVLQEYAQKMNYAIPTYVCDKDGSSSRSSLYTCTVDIGGIQYIGAASRTKKEAEIKAARTALLAIRSSDEFRGEIGNKTNYTVLPCKRKIPETAPPKEETSKPKKSKKLRFHKKPRKHMRPGFSSNQIQAANASIYDNSNVGPLVTYPNVQVAGNGQSAPLVESSAQIIGDTNVNFHTAQPSCVEGDINIGSGNSMVLEMDTNNNSVTDISPMINASISSQLNTPVPENPNPGVDQREEAPTLTDPNQDKEENNTQSSEQLGAVNPDSTIGAVNLSHGLADADSVVDQSGEAPAMTEVNPAKACNNDIDVGTIVHSVNSRASEPFGAVNSDCTIGAVNPSRVLGDADSKVDQSEEAPTTDVVPAKECNNDTDVGVIVHSDNSRACEPLGAANSDSIIESVIQLDGLADADSKVDLSGEAPAMTEVNPAKECNNDTDVSVVVDSVNSQPSESLGAVNSNSIIEAVNPSHGLTDTDSKVDLSEEATTMTAVNSAKECNNDNNIGTTDHLENSRDSEQVDAEYSDSRVVRKDPAHCQVDATDVLIAGSDQSHQTVKNPDNAEG